jgi:hypothetical protein
LRDQRLLAYARFLEAADAAVADIVAIHGVAEGIAAVSTTEPYEVLRLVSAASANVILLGPEAVADRARQMINAVGAGLGGDIPESDEREQMYTAMREARLSFIAAAQSALGV